MSAGDMSGEALACLITKSRDWFAVFRNDVTDLVVGTYSRVHDRYSPSPSHDLRLFESHSKQYRTACTCVLKLVIKSHTIYAYTCDTATRLYLRVISRVMLPGRLTFCRAYAVMRCPSVSLSVTFVDSVEMNKHRPIFKVFHNWVANNSSFSIPNVMAIFRLGPPPLTGASNAPMW